MTEKPYSVSIVLSDKQTEGLDNWRMKQPNVPSRRWALLHLIELALGEGPKPETGPRQVVAVAGGRRQGKIESARRTGRATAPVGSLLKTEKRK